MFIVIHHGEGSEDVFFLKVARLQNEARTKDFLLSYEFSYEKCSEIVPEIFEPLFGADRKGLSIAKNHPKPSQEFSEQFGPSIHKLKGFSMNSPQEVHPNFAQNLGRQILGNTFSGLDRWRVRKFSGSLRAKGTLISEPPFSTPCEMQFFPREKGKTAFSKKNPRQSPFSLSRVGKTASRRG